MTNLNHYKDIIEHRYQNGPVHYWGITPEGGKESVPRDEIKQEYGFTEGLLDHIADSLEPGEKTRIGLGNVAMPVGIIEKPKNYGLRDENVSAPEDQTKSLNRRQKIDLAKAWSTQLANKNNVAPTDEVWPAPIAASEGWLAPKAKITDSSWPAPAPENRRNTLPTPAEAESHQSPWPAPVPVHSDSPASPHSRVTNAPSSTLRPPETGQHLMPAESSDQPDFDALFESRNVSGELFLLDRMRRFGRALLRSKDPAYARPSSDQPEPAHVFNVQDVSRVEDRAKSEIEQSGSQADSEPNGSNVLTFARTEGPSIFDRPPVATQEDDSEPGVSTENVPNKNTETKKPKRIKKIGLALLAATGMSIVGGLVIKSDAGQASVNGRVALYRSELNDTAQTETAADAAEKEAQTEVETDDSGADETSSTENVSDLDNEISSSGTAEVTVEDDNTIIVTLDDDSEILVSSDN